MDSKPKNPEDEPYESTGRTLDAEGNLEGEAGQAPPAPALPTPSRVRREPPAEKELELEPRAAIVPLELEARPARAESDYVPPREPPKARLPRGGSTSSTSVGPLVLFLVLAAAGAAGWYFLIYQPNKAKEPAPRARIAVVIFINSEPVGARVSVEGTPVGVTPWAADNTWGEGPVHVTVTAAGYRPWTGTFPGGRPARLEAHLQRK